MSVYRFKIFFEDDESVWREIEIKSTQTFEDFHQVIQKAINFDDAHPASFFISNDTWRKGKEIRLLRSRRALQKGIWMHETKIATHVEDPHQKMIYEFDPEGTCWVIYAELLKILPDSPIEYPRISKSVGSAPAQYKLTTPVEVVEDEEEETHIEADDSYVHAVEGHHLGDEEEEAEEAGVPLRAKAITEDGEEEVIEEGEESEEFEEDAGFEEEDI